MDFRASNFLVFTSQNIPETALPPRRAFQFSLIIQSSVAKGNSIFSLPFLGAIANAVALFLYQKGWKFSISFLNQSENRGSQISHGLSYQKLGKELMSQDELAVMDGGKCIYMLRGVRPFLSEKYDLTKHPNYKYTADADPKNVFDMERYMKKRRAVVKPTDTFEVYEINITT